MKLLLLILTLAYPDLNEDKIRIEKSYDINSPKDFTVLVDNIYGFIEVEPSTDDKVHLVLEIEISGRTDELVARAKRELELGEESEGDTLLLFTKAPFIKRCNWGNFSGFDMKKKPDYSFRYQYKLKVPKEVGIYAKTVEKGHVLIKDMQGIVRACNVNGPVDIENARDVREASTVNGDVNISLTENLKESVAFNTVNGDFTFRLPENFNAKIFFDSMNGELYTAFDYKKMIPKVEKSDKNGRFKIGTKTGVEIGSGGQELSFRSINGNVYLKKGTR
ncbi:MAG: hypothetical protein RIM99_02550 [Cyclobacteriaceae bacterium]